MRLPDPERTCDVLIVATRGAATDLAGVLRDQLVGRSLRVKLSALPPGRSMLPLPPEVKGDAAKAGCCVVLAVKLKPGKRGRGSETYMYAILTAPKFPGQVAKPAQPDAKPGPGEYEMGTMQGDVRTLAEQIANRLPSAQK